MRSVLVFFVFASLLAGCLSTKPSNPQPDGPVSDRCPGGPPPETGLSLRDRKTKAIGLLEHGKATEACVELEAALAEAPTDKVAQNLISQIDGDPVAMLGSKNWAYTVQKGESLSSIADGYLGDKLKFFVLARYNGIDNPSQLKAGETIKVPGEKPVATAPPAPEPGPVPPVPPDPTQEKIAELRAKVEQLETAGNYPGAIEIVEGGLKEFPEEAMVKELGASIFAKFGNNLLEQHKYEEAAARLERAATLAPGIDGIAEQLADARKAVRADGLYRDGQRYEKANAKIDALQSYQAALKVWPNHDDARVALNNVRPEVAELYYREARTAFQKQDLDTALKLYDKTLEIDPNHEWAKVDRQRTVQLIKKRDEL